MLNASVAWKSFFMTTWANFDVRFDAILASMARHSDLITRGATTNDIKQWRHKMDTEVTAKEKDRLYRQRSSVISWLGLEQPSQDDECERLLRDCIEDSCDWILKNQTIQSWLQIDTNVPVVWLHGKPGAGRS